MVIFNSYIKLPEGNMESHNPAMFQSPPTTYETTHI